MGIACLGKQRTRQERKEEQALRICCSFVVSVVLCVVFLGKSTILMMGECDASTINVTVQFIDTPTPVQTLALANLCTRQS